MLLIFLLYFVFLLQVFYLKIHHCESEFLSMSNPCNAGFELPQKFSSCGAGMKSGLVRDDQISESSWFDNVFRGRYGRLDNPNFCWIAGESHQQDGEWIQVDFETPTRIVAVVTQGRPTAEQWVTSFKIHFGNSTNDLQFVQSNNTDVIFSGNTDRNSHVINDFPTPITARYFRLVEQTFQEFPSVRMDYLIC